MPEWMQQAAQLLRYHQPSGGVSLPLWPAVAAVVAGFALCLAGARLVRAGLTLGFLGGGAVLGAHMAVRYQASTAAGVVLGALVVGLIGYICFRIWVAVCSGAAAAAIAICIAAGSDLPNLWLAFENERMAAGAPEGGYSLVSPEQQEALRAFAPLEYGRLLWSYVRAERPQLVRTSAWAAGAAFFVGAAVGLVAYRWAVAAGVAMLGTLLLTVGGLVLLDRYNPTVIDWCARHGRWFLMALGGWLLFATLWNRAHYRRVRPLPPLVADEGKVSG